MSFLDIKEVKEVEKLLQKLQKEKSFFKITKLYHGFKPNQNKFFWK